MHAFQCVIDLEDANNLKIVKSNLQLELGNKPNDRVTVSIDSEETKLIIDLEAEDLVMMRAFVNSILRMIMTIQEIIEKVE